MSLRSGGIPAAILLTSLALGSCNTDPSGGCRVTLSGAVSQNTACRAVTFTAVNGSPEAVYTDSIGGTPSVTIVVEYPGPPFGVSGFGAADGEGARIAVRSGTDGWVMEIGSGADSGSVTVAISSENTLRSAPDTTVYQAHGTLDATLVPTSTSVLGPVMLRMTF